MTASALASFAETNVPAATNSRCDGARPRACCSFHADAIAAASPVLQDAIVCGEGRDQVGLVAWLNAAGCRQVTGEDGDLAFYARHPKVHAHIRAAFAQWNKINTGATMRVARVLLLPDMPSIDRNEITDKGYINQRVALECRSADVVRLFDGATHPDVVVS